MDSNAQYYILEGEKISNKLNEAATLINEDLILKIKSISDELEKINDKSGEPHIEKCHDMTEKLQEIFDQITKQYTHNVIEKNAADWQQKYNALKAIEGNNGYDWAKANGFKANEETITKNDKNSKDNFVYTDGMALSDAFLTLFGNNKQKNTTKTIYHWTAYTDITIDSNGYINISINSYKSEDGSVTGTGSSTCIIRDESSYNTYYNGRGSIGSSSSGSSSTGTQDSISSGSHGF